jgi:sugar/nucleoside kinase (ribokinase family)
MKYDVVTFGSATRDVFLLGDKLKAYRDKKFETGKAFCFEIGSKNEVEKIVFSTGGGATNAAATFSSFGFKCACVSNIGKDPNGDASVAELERLGIDTRYLNISKKLNTGYSVLLSSASVGGRMVVVYRGASLNFSEIKLPKIINADWFYMTSVAGNMKFLSKIINYADKNNIRVAINPGSKELKYGLGKLSSILKKVSLLNLNQEEAAKLTGEKFNDLDKIIKKLMSVIEQGVVVITRGPEGLVACDGKECYQAGILPGKVVERTGAGDSFGSGLVSGLMMKDSIEYAIQLGSANATSVIKEVGAKNGILGKSNLRDFRKIKVNKYKLK